jgi:FG-GAP repeat
MALTELTSHAPEPGSRTHLLAAPALLVALLLALVAGAGVARAGEAADSAPATVLLRANPLLQLGEKLTAAATGDSSLAGFGADVAISADGNTAIVGAPGDDGGRGAAWVFTREGSTWTQQSEKLTDGEVTGGSLPEAVAFGASVAISADGSTALVGGPGDSADHGAVWAFVREGSSWAQQGEKVTGGEEEGASELGRSVALSADGATALAGGPLDAKGIGAVWVFTREGAAWAQQGPKLLGAHEAGHGQFGGSVALSGEGDTALIGARTDHSLFGSGAAWVFVRDGSTWTQQGEKLTGAGATASAEFASSVALSDDGETALIGGEANEGGIGAAWAFTHEGSTWTQQGEKLTSGEAVPTAGFGSAVALSANGTKALIGASGDAQQAGAAWDFASKGAGWARQGAKLTGGGESGAAAFGASVALSDGAHTALVGGPQDSLGSGAVWAFADGALEELPAGSETDLSGAGKPRGSAAASTIASAAVNRPHPRGGLSTASISSTRLATLFARALRPSGPGARIETLLERGAFAASLRAFAPGKATIEWYRLSHGAAHASKQTPPVLVASGRIGFRRAGTARIEVKLTRAGARLLRRSKRLALSAKGMFVPNGAEAIEATRAFSLVR